MEPCLNLALELQAIGRVHRLGQKRPVRVRRLAYRNSVEQQILRVHKHKADEAKKLKAAQEGGGSGGGSGGSGSGSGSMMLSGNKRSSTSMATGSITRDRAEVKADEFKILFGTKSVEETLGTGTDAAAGKGKSPAKKKQKKEEMRSL